MLFIATLFCNEVQPSKLRFLKAHEKANGHSEQGFIAKKTRVLEHHFYDTLSSYPSLKRFTPAYHGTNDENDDFVEVFLEDFITSAGISNCTNIDVKLGGILHHDSDLDDKKNKKMRLSSSTTSGTLGLRLTSLTFHNDNDYKTKQHGKQMSEEELIRSIITFAKPIKERLISDIEDLKLELSQYYGYLIGTSLLVAYDDHDPSKYVFKLLNFNRSYITLDKNEKYNELTDILDALTNLLTIVQETSLTFEKTIDIGSLINE